MKFVTAEMTTLACVVVVVPVVVVPVVAVPVVAVPVVVVPVVAVPVVAVSVVAVPVVAVPVVAVPVVAVPVVADLAADADVVRVRVFVRVCVRVCVRACVPACVRACVRACVHACVRMRARAFLPVHQGRFSFRSACLTVACCHSRIWKPLLNIQQCSSPIIPTTPSFSFYLRQRETPPRLPYMVKPVSQNRLQQVSRRLADNVTASRATYVMQEVWA